MRTTATSAVYLLMNTPVQLRKQFGNTVKSSSRYGKGDSEPIYPMASLLPRSAQTGIIPLVGHLNSRSRTKYAVPPEKKVAQLTINLSNTCWKTDGNPSPNGEKLGGNFDLRGELTDSLRVMAERLHETVDIVGELRCLAAAMQRMS